MQQEQPKQYRFYDGVMALFITTLLLSNLLSSAKIIDLGVSIGGFSFIFDAGTLIFPISYIFGDILTEVYGYKRARRVIWMGFLASALMAFFVWLAGALPNLVPENESAYDLILGGITGLVVASLSAYWIGSFSNSYVLAKMKIATKGKWLWSRTIGSTMVGQGVDTITFITIATVLGVFTWGDFASLVITNYILKVGIEVIMTPLTVQVVGWLKRAENEDAYDYDTAFNPFKMSV
ncbi:MAG: queuosine precursor transporter [Anaerolineae bacterium]|nr:queuosine precursor transporter [Anaerolineae bacterium]